MEKVLSLLEGNGGKARIIASYTNKCRQLIRQPIVYGRKSTTRAAKSTPFVHVCFIVCTQNDVSVMSMHKVYTYTVMEIESSWRRNYGSGSVDLTYPLFIRLCACNNRYAQEISFLK
ncbi:hypothetical protein HOLleu_03302 [Holothuria leucospilota]|uniref:Uncharacterized protein n=1 Tax=Holothuria leucospilota TaxID=206669 RepID=A0A9Q1CRF6_HOLLE|nr:hypothetical protein HOLleu_03302 [Holothuria leucospilota]